MILSIRNSWFVFRVLESVENKRCDFIHLGIHDLSSGCWNQWRTNGVILSILEFMVCLQDVGISEEQTV